jgi:hypothetical protein
MLTTTGTSWWKKPGFAPCCSAVTAAVSNETVETRTDACQRTCCLLMSLQCTVSANCTVSVSTKSAFAVLSSDAQMKLAHSYKRHNYCDDSRSCGPLAAKHRCCRQAERRAAAPMRRCSASTYAKFECSVSMCAALLPKRVNAALLYSSRVLMVVADSEPRNFQHHYWKHI